MTQEEINIRISEGQINGRLEKIKDDLYSNWSQYPGEPEVCSHFGCGKKLTITERLYGKNALIIKI
jgi:hypothetical protein